MAGLTGLAERIDHSVIENPTHAEGDGAMTGCAVHSYHWMCYDRACCTDAMAGVAANVQYRRAAMIGKRINKTLSRVTLTALAVRFRVRRTGRFPGGYGTVMATRAGTQNAAMVESAIEIQVQKVDGVVAIVTLGVGVDVKLGFSQRQITIVALAALAEYFQVIDETDERKAQGAVAGLAGITCSQMSRRLVGDVDETLVVAV